MQPLALQVRKTGSEAFRLQPVSYCACVLFTALFEWSCRFLGQVTEGSREEGSDMKQIAIRDLTRKWEWVPKPRYLPVG